MSRVLVVDDERRLTDALDAALTRAGHEVTVAHDGHRGVELAASDDPELMILDLSLPGLHGLEVIDRIRTWLDVPILVLSATADNEVKARALDAGADDYLQKPFGLDELEARLRALDRRARREGAETVVRFVGGLDVDLADRAVTLDGAEVRLTPTEWRLLRALVLHRHRLLTHHWLLQEVWGSRYGEETRDALRTHVRMLRAKLRDPAPAPRFIRTESGAGYRWVGETAAERPPPVDGPEARALVHELANAVTALRLAAQLVSRQRPGDLPPALDRTYDRLDALSTRVGELVTSIGSPEAP